jgi:hypothetical protein
LWLTTGDPEEPEISIVATKLIEKMIVPLLLLHKLKEAIAAPLLNKGLDDLFEVFPIHHRVFRRALSKATVGTSAAPARRLTPRFTGPARRH